MKNLILIAVLAIFFTSCATVGEGNYTSNYSERIDTRQKLVPFKTRKKAREFAQSTPNNGNPILVYEDRPRDWTSPRHPWNHWPRR